MDSMLLVLTVLWIFPVCYGLSARGGTSDGSEEWGYIPVRPGASMFYWFYRTTHPDGYKNRPIVLWLQGGPGISGTGIGNFLEIGPLDQNLEPRDATWVQSVNLLIVDSPIGSGFSICDNESLIPSNRTEVALDLLIMLKVFMKEHDNLSENPLYIFGQSYGGQITVHLAYHLDKAIKAGEIGLSLKGVAIGNACLSQTDAFVNRPVLLHVMSIIDYSTYSMLNETMWRAYEKAEEGDYSQLWVAHVTINSLKEEDMPCVSVYNILDVAPIDYSVNSTFFKTRNSQCIMYNSIYMEEIENVMNTKIRQKLGIIPDEKIFSRYVPKINVKLFSSKGFFDPVWKLVDDLLKDTDLDIIVYQGQLDVICNTAGAIGWIQKLSWPGLTEYNRAQRETLENPETKVPEMFVKSHERFHMFWVLNAGHAVPTDVPDVALRMLNRIIAGESHSWKYVLVGVVVGVLVVLSVIAVVVYLLCIRK